MDRLVTSLTRLAAAFPRDNATEATLAVYAEELSRLEQDTVCDALDTLIRSSRRLPALADIIEEYHQERERQWERMKRESAEAPALPIARAPMPDSLRKQLRAFQGIFDRRAADLEAE